ncbi:brorin-like [Lineus longissimus]|uniref:brorin-like n=1 Tax=Lineus longissimus TaxID=88925 RepID=UPI002B4DCE6B
MSFGAICLLVVIGLATFVDARSHHHKHHHRRTDAETDSSQGEPSVERRSELCVYENDTYTAGEKFRPDPCTFCRCPRRGGRAVCSVMDCKYDKGCLRYETEPGECCGKCMEQGCLHTDGRVYPKGSEVRSDVCTKCFCPKDSQHTLCMKTECPMAMCVDPVTLPKQCCGYCPRGPNCHYRGGIISAREVIRVDRCIVCHCPNPLKDRSLDAVCTNICQIKTDIIRKEIEKKNMEATGTKDRKAGI